MSIAKLLVANALVQITFSALLGSYLLHRIHMRNERAGSRDLVAAHVDWIMLALVEAVVAGGIVLFEVEARVPALLVVVGGWLNPVPYLARGFGINAFVLAGGPVQRTLAAIGASSVLVLTTGLVWFTALVLAS